jgi:hypothetical protein
LSRNKSKKRTPEQKPLPAVASSTEVISPRATLSPEASLSRTSSFPVPDQTRAVVLTEDDESPAPAPGSRPIGSGWDFLHAFQSGGVPLSTVALIVWFGVAGAIIWGDNSAGVLKIDDWNAVRWTGIKIALALAVFYAALLIYWTWGLLRAGACWAYEMAIERFRNANL